MRIVGKLFFTFLANIAGITAAWYFIPGFTIAKFGIQEVVFLAGIFMILNISVKPLLKLVLGPVILITLGTGLIIVNVIVLYILDIASENLTIETIPALLYATLAISLVNFLVHALTRK